MTYLLTCGLLVAATGLGITITDWLMHKFGGTR